MRTRAGWLIAGVCIAALVAAAPSNGQSYRLRGVSPIFDGWETLPDGSRLFYFGYINRSDVEVVLPLGDVNTFDPAPIDRGQPTSFLPGRHEHVFTVKIPQNFSGKWTWSLRSEMGVQSANASLDQLYILEERENEDPNARPPEIVVADQQARVGESVTLRPAIKAVATSGQVVLEGARAEAAGLNVAWSKYRGPGSVTFEAAPGATMPVPGGRGGRGAAGGAQAGIFTLPCGSKPAPDCGGVTSRFSVPGEYS